MSIPYFNQSCFLLSGSSILSFVEARYFEKPKKSRIDYLLNHTIQAEAIGIIFDVGRGLVYSQSSSITHYLSTTVVIPIMTSVMIHHYFSKKLENNLTKYMRITNCISSIAIIILLIPLPNTQSNYIFYAIALLTVGINTSQLNIFQNIFRLFSNSFSSHKNKP